MLPLYSWKLEAEFKQSCNKAFRYSEKTTRLNIKQSLNSNFLSQSNQVNFYKGKKPKG